MLSYEYLRLYVNAFAYQATLNRAVARFSRDLAVGEKFQGPQGLLFANAAATPDARFIYEALDAAKSLIGTFNSFIDPVECLRYMPLKYYLYVIYAAVFLFKVRQPAPSFYLRSHLQTHTYPQAEATGALGIQASTSVRRSIAETIERLRKSSTGPADMGHRYSRLLRLLWRKAPTQNGDQEYTPTIAAQRQPHDAAAAPVGEIDAAAAATAAMGVNPLNAFSWRDLDAVGQFVINDEMLAASSMGGYDDMSQSFSAFDVYGTDGYSNYHDMLGSEFTF